MPGWKGIVGEAFTPDAFDRYCHTLQWNAWRPSFIVLHNTAVPSLAQLPHGFETRNMANLEHYYRDQQNWKAGPHLFVDDRRIWIFTPLTVSGTHSPSWNKSSLGVEMLGNYQIEPFDSGRGLAVRQNTVAAIATLSAILGIDCSTMRIHRDDPATDHKCPGKHVAKVDVIREVQALMSSRHGGDHSDTTGIQEYER
jgi:N-acetylmuramoyl-L-alanine amidase CwlA